MDLFLLDPGVNLALGPPGFDRPEFDSHAGSHFHIGNGLAAPTLLVQEPDQRELWIVRWFPAYFFEDLQPEV